MRPCQGSDDWWPLTAKTRVQSQTISPGVCRVQTVNETRFYVSSSVSPASVFPPISHAHFHSFIVDGMGRDSSLGIATNYGLDGPRIESWWGSRFSAPVQTGPGAHPTSYTMGTLSFPGVKRQGVVLTTHFHLASRLKKE
jgi:hypothetical protein